MISSDRPTIRIAGSDQGLVEATNGWRFRFVQAAVVVVAIYVADSTMTQGVFRRELSRVCFDLWRTAAELVHRFPLFW